MQKKWVKEVARDLIAFGGLPFLIITIIRVATADAYYPMQFIIGSVVFFILRFFLKADLRSGLAFVICVFTSLFYNHTLFTMFATLIYIGIIASLFYLKHRKSEILTGIILGLISTAISYFIVKIVFKNT
jgi:hypothetical protein